MSDFLDMAFVGFASICLAAFKAVPIFLIVYGLARLLRW